MVPNLPPSAKRKLGALPLQSPGICAYLLIRGSHPSPFLGFHLPGGNEPCRLLVVPKCTEEASPGVWRPARLIAPMNHAEAEVGGTSGQREFLDRVLAESWWRESTTDVRILATRTPSDWGREYHLYRDGMNPVMTARFMRAGRLPHRSPYVERLYFAGSATHPGQWVSFCAISGILAADCVRSDLRGERKSACSPQ
jgi:hypothetical protein